MARIFYVPLDELVGMDEIKNTKNIAILREALQSFPNNYELLAELTIYLTRLQADDEAQLKNNKEAIEISERILKFCTDNEIRNHILGNLSYLYSHIGENEKIVPIQKALEDLAMLFHLNLKALADVNAHFEIEFTIPEKLREYAK